MTDKTDALRARELLAAEYTKRGMGVDFVNDAGTPTAIALAAIREALSAPAEGGQPAASVDVPDTTHVISPAPASRPPSPACPMRSCRTAS